VSEAPKDPFSFSFGVDFESSATRVKGEAAAREDLAKRRLKYHVTFLDDLLRGILPRDLILVGAETGAGKTEFALSIARQNAMVGKRVCYFALEAEPLELERRTKFAVLAEMASRDNAKGFDALNYTDWYLGEQEHIVGKYNERAEALFKVQMSGLRTYYRGSKFDHDDIRRLFLAIQDSADLIVLDHLHYVDIEDENENRGFKRTIKMIRDVALGMGKPVILIAHLRKRDMRAKQIVPDAEMFHGSSDVIKICTHIVMLAPARGIPAHASHVSNTFIHVPKDRMGGATGLVALCQFDRRFKRYLPSYSLGRPSFSGDSFEPLPPNETPRWAKHARAMP
jgi:replicative DNA helicase